MSLPDFLRGHQKDFACYSEALKNRKSEGCFSLGKECATSQQGLTHLQEWKGEGHLLTLSCFDPSPLISASEPVGFENVRIFPGYPAGRTNSKNGYHDTHDTRLREKARVPHPEERARSKERG